MPLVLFIKSRWFLFAIIASLTIGLVMPGPFTGASQSQALKNGLVAVVMFLMAIPLDLATIRRAISAPTAVLLGTGVNMIIIPIMAFVVALALPVSTGRGLLVASAVPSTLASGAIWTRRAGGNDAAVFLITIITNGACFLLTPAILIVTIGQTVELDWTMMLVELAVFVVGPIILTQILRLHRHFGTWASRHKNSLSLVAQIGILFMTLLGAVQMRSQADISPNSTDTTSFDTKRGERSDAVTVDRPEPTVGSDLKLTVPRLPVLWEIVVVVPCVLGLHLGAMGIGIAAGRWIGLDAADRTAVAIGGSQKTLMIGLKISMDLGVSILPMILFHFVQLIVDLLIIDWWRVRYPNLITLEVNSEPPAVEVDVETGVTASEAEQS